MPLDRPVIESLLEAATLAPNAHDAQPWEFFVVEGYETISELAKRGKNWLQEQVAHNPTAEAISQRQQLMDPQFDLLHGAAVLVLVVSKSYEKQVVEDCSLAAYALMLAARDRMIGSFWIGSAVPWLNLHAIESQQGILDGSCVVAPVVLGYPRTTGLSSRLARRPLFIGARPISRVVANEGSVYQTGGAFTG